MTDNAYPKLAGGAPDLPALELEVLDYWSRDDTFRASIARRDGAPEYVFYDGPPFANGLPHYGHLLTGYVKDIVPRYRTMRGYKVERRFGWDTHGLPAELEVERQLGITDKSQIEAMGIAAFNDACRASVLRYTDEWQAYVTRQARWVDFDNDYKTLDLAYMESVIWAFKQLWDKGLAYEGYRVLPYCWRDETPLSNHELRMDDDVYQSRQDPAVTVGFKVVGGQPDNGLDGAYLLVWTTTPWTLPSNLAVAVSPDITYVQVQAGDRRFVLAEARLAAYARELGEEPVVLGTYRGAELLGTRYLPPFAYFMDWPNAFQVLAGDFVTTDDGTGIVHMAPAYGEDDMVVAEAVGIAPVTPVDSKGRFDVTVADYQGQHVFDANAQIVRDLKTQSGPAAVNGPVLIRHETYEHPYPHCWRCRNPLIYRSVSSWVRQGDGLPRPHGGAKPADHVVSRTRQGRPVRQVAAGRPRLVDLPESLLGYPDSGMEVRRPGLPAHRCLRQPTTSWSATSAYARPICTGPTSTSSPVPTQTIRLAVARCDAFPMCSTCGSTRDPCRMPRCTTRSRTWIGSRDTTPATSSSSTSGRPVAGFTHCMCWRPRSLTGRHSKPVWRMGLSLVSMARR